MTSWRSDSYNPPYTNLGNSQNELHDVIDNRSSQRLITLLRLLEKEDSQVQKHLSEVSSLMNAMISNFSRKGFLLGDVERAEKALSSNAGHSRDKANKKKTASEKANGSAKDNPDSSGIQSENLLFTALLRILNDPKTFLKSNCQLKVDMGFLIALAAEVSLAMTQYTMMSPNPQNKCNVAEQELLAEFGKPLLSGLSSSLRWLLEDIQSEFQSGSNDRKMRCLSAADLDDYTQETPIVSCLKATSSLVSLFGTRLSRSTALLSELKDLSWHFLTAPSHSVQYAAAMLLSCIPLAGGVERQTSSQIWSSAVSDIVIMLSQIINTVAPLSEQQKKHEDALSEDGRKVLQALIFHIEHDRRDESGRVVSFSLLLRGLVRCLTCFLERDYRGQSQGSISGAELNVDRFIDLVEYFVSYPLSAETLFFRTKKRLRDEEVAGGLISSRAIATRVANEVKFLGHTMLDCLLDSFGGPMLLPYARRLFRISYASLLTSCSGAVRSVMDPSTSLNFEGKKRRWLHLSITLRTAAVRTVNGIHVAFGSDRTSKTSESTSSRRSDGEMAILLVAACLLEQINMASNIDEPGDCWGALQERLELTESCLQCLRGVLSSCSGHLSLSTRSTIDSIVLRCLDIESGFHSSQLLGESFVKSQVFELAATCVSTPWNDGGATSIVDTLTRAASTASMAPDRNVALSAANALRVCDQFSAPRAPPLLHVGRDHPEVASEGKSASELSESIAHAQAEARKARAALEEAERAKMEEKRKRHTIQEFSKKQRLEEKLETSKDAGRKPVVHAKSAESISNDHGSSPPPKVQEGQFEGRSEQEKVGPTKENKKQMPLSEDKNSESATAGVSTVPEMDVMDASPSEVPLEDGIDDDDDEFPDIVEGGPDSDDE